MANAIYSKWKKKRFDGTYTYDLTAATIRMILIDTASYTFSQSHEFLSDVAGGAIVGSAVTLANDALTISGSNVLYSADPVAFTGLSSAPTIEAVIIYRDTAIAGTSDLIAYIDTATGLPTASGLTSVTVTQHASDKFIKF